MYAFSCVFINPQEFEISHLYNTNQFSAELRLPSFVSSEQDGAMPCDAPRPIERPSQWGHLMRKEAKEACEPAG